MLSDNIMKKITKKILAIILCVCFISITGCGNGSQAKLVSNADLSTSSYELGDYMGDYSVTDINGNTYKFSELLETKKAIVLNFWFIDCDPCKMEFPYLQAASDKYSEDIAVIAINPTTDKENDIKKYAAQNQLTLPLVKGDMAWSSALSITGYPTTVVVDRYGKIALSHEGAITQDGVFGTIFKFFSDDDYKQSIIRNISDIM